ncbi:MAG: WYL domain-containing protein [Geminicoccaceae bacterium]|nr:WYL domain-containing protein [Geminicoccaceae bacterium]
MNARTRHDALLRILRRRGLSTVERLATEVGVSRRTVLRDIAMLRDQGYVIHSEPGRGGGLQLDPACVQMTARPTVWELFALLISVRIMRASRTLPFSDLADAGLARIEKALPPQEVRDLRAILDRLHVGRLSPRQDIGDAGTVDPALLPAFERAFVRRMVLRFRYCDAKNNPSDRQVEPQAMLLLPSLWYLVAWDPGRAGFRHFRMDRISRPEIVEGPAFRHRHVPFEEDVCPFRDLPR